MNEPEYTFVKGKGWTNNPTLTLPCGTVVYYELRKPREGELGTYKATVEDVLKIRIRYENFVPWTIEMLKNYSGEDYDQKAWITVWK